MLCVCLKNKWCGLKLSLQQLLRCFISEHSILAVCRPCVLVHSCRPRWYSHTMRVCVSGYVCVCVCEWVYVCMCLCVCVCVRLLGKGSKLLSPKHLPVTFSISGWFLSFAWAFVLCWWLMSLWIVQDLELTKRELQAARLELKALREQSDYKDRLIAVSGIPSILLALRGCRNTLIQLLTTCRKSFMGNWDQTSQARWASHDFAFCTDDDFSEFLKCFDHQKRIWSSVAHSSKSLPFWLLEL